MKHRHRVLLIGENHFIRLSPTDSDNFTTVTSFWRISYSPQGPGHALFVRSELSGGAWRVFTDNPAMTRWLQAGIQGMLNEALKNTALVLEEASFAANGDPAVAWRETVTAKNDELQLSWLQLGEPLLIHTQPGTGPGERPNGMCSVFGQAWPRAREQRPFSTCALALAESWTETR